MKLSFDIGWWFEVEREDDNVILSTSDGNGNIVEINIKDGWLNKKRIKQFIKDLESTLLTDSKSRGKK